MYTFNIIGVSPILHFFNQQQIILQHPQIRVEYLPSYRCTLDSFIQAIELVSPQREWDFDQIVNTVVDFWMHNSEAVSHWKRRLEDAGSDSVLVSRVADLDSLRSEFEFLLLES
jgi:hypothetical protein